MPLLRLGGLLKARHCDSRRRTAQVAEGLSARPRSQQASARVGLAGELYEGGYDGVDARVSYEWTMANGGTVAASVFGKNLTDEEWREQALFLGGPNTGFQGWGAPRTYAFELLITM